ncbi:facilitated trehalose transporter Tret1-like [Schistocerca cancellata]|uniref:facilitated trehalose transporter Tret1-like n=1 Tax=Schistocerca cancellata TaxID=274614 RepID=UPI002119053B|nr:facilitated trehalose transporter Tret1-like [Schistocerca cancellata]
MPPEMEPSVLNGSSTPNYAEKREQQNGGPRPKEDLRKRIRAALPQVLATSAKNVLLLGYGMTLGFPTIVIPAVSRRPLVAGDAGNATLGAAEEPGHLTLSDAELSWFSSINLICVPLGCLLSGPLSTPIGRRPAMMLVNLPLAAAWLLFHFAQSVGMLYAGLALAGASGGLLEAPVLTYVAEITEPRFRGALSATSSTSVIVGVFTQFLLGNLLPWRTVALVNLVCPVAAVIALCFVPESPHWLVGKGRLAAAEKALCWLRGWVQPEDIRQELNELVVTIGGAGSADKAGASAATQQQQQRQQPAWRNYLKRTFVRPYLLVSASFAIGHFCGMTTVQTYAVVVFSQLGAPAGRYTATLLLGVAQLLGALTGVCSVHRFGKRPLALLSAAGNGACFVVVAILAAHSGPASEDSNTWTPSLILVAASFMSHVGLRMLPWILIGEVYPAEVRGTASGASGSMGYILGFAANKSFLSLVHTVSLAGTLMLYGCVSLLGCVLLFFVLPETEGHSLHEIEAHFARTDGRCCQPGGGLTRRGRHRKQRADHADPRWAAANPALELNETHI